MQRKSLAPVRPAALKKSRASNEIVNGEEGDEDSQFGSSTLPVHREKLWNRRWISTSSWLGILPGADSSRLTEYTCMIQSVSFV